MSAAVGPYLGTVGVELGKILHRPGELHALVVQVQYRVGTRTLDGVAGAGAGTDRHRARRVCTGGADGERGTRAVTLDNPVGEAALVVHVDPRAHPVVDAGPGPVGHGTAVVVAKLAVIEDRGARQPVAAARVFIPTQRPDVDGAVRKLLRRAARDFGTRERLARARCRVAEAEVALATRDLKRSARSLDAAVQVLEVLGDNANALHARLIESLSSSGSDPHSV